MSTKRASPEDSPPEEPAAKEARVEDASALLRAGRFLAAAKAALPEINRVWHLGLNMARMEKYRRLNNEDHAVRLLHTFFEQVVGSNIEFMTTTWRINNTQLQVRTATSDIDIEVLLVPDMRDKDGNFNEMKLMTLITLRRREMIEFARKRGKVYGELYEGRRLRAVVIPFWEARENPRRSPLALTPVTDGDVHECERCSSIRVTTDSGGYVDDQWSCRFGIASYEGNPFGYGNLVDDSMCLDCGQTVAEYFPLGLTDMEKFEDEEEGIVKVDDEEEG